MAREGAASHRQQLFALLLRVSAPPREPLPVAAALAVLISLHADVAAAWRPEFAAGVEVGGGFDPERGGAGDGLFVLGGHADVMLFRSLSSDFGIGFTTQVATRGFGDLLLLGGAGALAPAHESFPFVLSGGAGVDAISGEGLWFARLWWGARNRNQTSRHSATLGVWCEYAAPFGGGSGTVIVGASLDALALLYPFLWLYQWAVVDQSPSVV